jgi:voltage-gated potassium channel
VGDQPATALSFSRRLARAARRGRFGLLFWLLVATIAVPVVVPDGPVIRTAMAAFLFVVMLTGLKAIAHNRRELIVGLVLAAPAVILNWVGLWLSDFTIYVISDFLYLAFFLYLAVLLLLWTLSRHEVDVETIYASVSVYLLMALVWGIAYYTIVLKNPGSFNFPDGDELGVIQERRAALAAVGDTEPSPEWTEIANSAQGTMMYYSFVTLTTLGYGDMYPLSDATRIMAMLEATLGQLYLVILVARLVGLYTAQDTERRRKATPT